MGPRGSGDVLWAGGCCALLGEEGEWSVAMHEASKAQGRKEKQLPSQVRPSSTQDNIRKTKSAWKRFHPGTEFKESLQDFLQRPRRAQSHLADCFLKPTHLPSLASPQQSTPRQLLPATLFRRSPVFFCWRAVGNKGLTFKRGLGSAVFYLSQLSR